MSKKITTKTIDEVTGLLPYVVADIVAEKTIHATFKAEIDNWANLDKQGKAELEAKTKAEQNVLTEYLTLRANTTFQYSESFNKKLKASGNKGRDYLYLFMYHWAGWYGEKIVGSYKKSMENYYRDIKQYQDCNLKEVGGVMHERDNSFDFNSHKTINKLHPLGTVYKDGKFGYVANGYDWWKFELSELDNIIKNHN